VQSIAVLLQSISGVSTINPLVAFYDIHGGKREVQFFILSRTPDETDIIIDITTKTDKIIGLSDVTFVRQTVYQAKPYQLNESTK
jgi:alpha-galactosidase/6-phospho-beta-glucosidase family protein